MVALAARMTQWAVGGRRSHPLVSLFVATRLHTAEALRPVVAAQRETDKETKGWDCLPTTAQRVILAASATTGTSILKSPPPTIHRFLNTRNATALQADCSLTYAGNNLYLPTSFCQALLQGHILAIPDPDAPTVLLPLLTPPYSAGPANAQQRAMRIQVLLSMRQDRLSKEEATRAPGPFGPVAPSLLPWTGDPVPSTGGLGSSSPFAGRSLVLRKMEG